jgi:diguanylate cyclase (GGDEF)-like protein/PAS domain S-box-containing protein
MVLGEYRRSRWVEFLIHHKWRFVPGILAALMTIGILVSGLAQPAEYFAYNALFHIRGPIPWSDQVVVIEIDEESLRRFGRFPWERDRHIQLLEALQPANPSVIAFDLLFSEPSNYDEEFAAAMASYGRIILARSWDASGSPLVPTPPFQAAALEVGQVHIWADADGLVRSVQLRQNGIETLGLTAVRIHQSVREASFVPLVNPLWINWLGPSDRANHYSYAAVIDGNVPEQALRDKIVLIGVTAAAIDNLQTPYERNPPTSGVYIHAAIISNLLQQTFLRRVGIYELPILLILLAPGLSALLTRWRFEHQLSTWIGLCLGWGVLGIALFHAHYWIPIATPMMLFALTGVSTAVWEQRRMHRLLRQSEERYALASQAANEGLWDWDLKRQVMYFSPRWKAMIGYADVPLSHSPQEWFGRVHPDDVEALKAAIASHLQGTVPQFEHEHRILHQDGTYRWVISRGLAVLDKYGAARRMVGSQSDITDRKQTEEQLLRDAYYDRLTGLPNRSLFLDRLKQAIAHQQQLSTSTFAVLMLDLDRFKVVNNSLGNDLGDQLLIAVAQRVNACLRLEETLARVGGDEFAILLQMVRGVSDVTHIAEQILGVLSLPFRLTDQDVFTTVSIGIAIGSMRYEHPEHLLRDADTATFRAKSLGGARYQVFDKTMHLRMISHLHLERDLRRAIATLTTLSAQPEFHLCYQPIVELSTGEIRGFEALVRWHHPEQGLIPPKKFVPLAEKNGLIVPLGTWLLRQACRQMHRWSAELADSRVLTINVNLASKQFSRPDLTEQIRDILEETQLDPAQLKLELTESTIMENAKSMVATLHQLKSLGIQLAIDDFGTGYSSLSYLRRFPIDTLKIDQSFIHRIGIDRENSEIIRTITSLAHTLKMNVTAEGVETANQLEQLLHMGCEYGQGYFFSPPIEAERAIATLIPQSVLPQEI